MLARPHDQVWLIAFAESGLLHQEKRRRSQLTGSRVNGKAERLQGNHTQEGAVGFLSKDNGCGSLAAIEAEKCIAYIPSDCRSIGQRKGFGPVRLDPDSF